MNCSLRPRAAGALLVIAIVSSLPLLPARAGADFSQVDEASPEEIAEGLAPFLSEAETAEGSRIVPPSDFGKYAIVVDIFRQSAKRPVLGKYDDAYLDAVTSTFKETRPDERAKLAKSRFATLANTEFAVISVDGKPMKANLISGALEAEISQPVKVGGVKQYDPVTGQVVTKRSKKSTPNGAFRLTPFSFKARPRGADGKPGASQIVDFPFLTSTTYERSTMYWGLHIFGGYLLHSTPHTGQLGRPASMGCVRQSFPDAMELWDFVANRSGGRQAMIRIHKMHSAEAYARLREIIYDPNYSPSDPKNALTPEAQARAALPSADYDLKWLVSQINGSYQRIRDYVAKYGSEHHGVGYAWIDPQTKQAPKPVFPTCSGYDCFKVWGDPLKQRARDLQADRLRDEQAKLDAEAKRNGQPTAL